MEAEECSRSAESHAAPVQHHWLFWAVVTPFDIVLCVLPLLFITFAGLAGSLNGTDVEAKPWGLKLVSAAQYGVTIYTVLYSTILGRSVEYIASWTVERGTSVFLLEQLLGSVSIFQTLQTQWLLRSLNLTSIALILLWALSPVGGQSTLRLLSVVDARVMIEDSVFVYDVPDLWHMTDSSDFGESNRYNSLSVVLSGSLSGTYKSNDQDTWGNLRLPFVKPNSVDGNHEFVKLNSTVNDRNFSADGFDTDTEQAHLTSIGLPFRKRGGSDRYRFLASTPYFPLTCEKISLQKKVDTRGMPDIWTWGLVQADVKKNSTDFGTLLYYSKAFEPKLYYSKAFEPKEGFHDADSDIPVVFIGYSATTCNVTIQRLEMEVECHKSDCKILRYRHTATERSPPSVSAQNIASVKQFLQGFSTALNSGPVTNQPSLSECYFTFGSFRACLAGIHPIVLELVKPELFSARLSQLFNSYWILDRAIFDVLGQEGDGVSPVWSKTVTKDDDYGILGTGYSTIKAEGTSMIRRYACHKIWLFWLAFSSLILLVVGVVGTLAKYSCHGPDILRHVSTLTRENEVAVVPDGSWMSGYERARAMKKVYIRLVDEEPEASTGKLMLSSSIDVPSLKKGRRYR